MLLNLLPGLRDLRAPVAAGYLWLAALWLLLIDAIPSRSRATGIIAHVYTLTHSLGHVTALAIISFIAYLIGVVLSVDADGIVVDALSRGRHLLSLDPLKILNPLGRMSEKVVADTNRLISQMRAGLSELKYNDDAADEEKIAITEWNSFVQGRLYSLALWPSLVWNNMHTSMLAGLVSEIRQLVTQLRVSSPALFDEYDRARGEAEFRLSVGFPLIAIAVVLAWKVTPLWLILIIGAVLIIRSGIKQAREATDVVVQAVLTWQVTPTGWVARNARPEQIAQEALKRAATSWEKTNTPSKHEDYRKAEIVLNRI